MAAACPGLDSISQLHQYGQANGVRPEFNLTKEENGQWRCIATCPGVEFAGEAIGQAQKESKKEAAERVIEFLEANNLLRAKRAKTDPIRKERMMMKTLPLPMPSGPLDELQGLWCDSRGQLVNVEGTIVIREDKRREQLREEGGYFIKKAAGPNAEEYGGAMNHGMVDWSSGEKWEPAASPEEPDVGDFTPANSKMIMNEFLKRKRLPELLQPTQFNVGSNNGFRAIAAFECGGCPISVAVISQNKKQASTDLAVQLCRRLFREGHLQSGTDKVAGSERYPDISIGLAPDLKNRLNTFLYNCQITPLREENPAAMTCSKEVTDLLLRMESSGWACTTEDISKGCQWSPATANWDPWKYRTVQANENAVNQQLYQKWQMSQKPDRIRARHELPIASMEHEIVDIITNNQVVLVSGATGSGKTTQIPQFILDHFITYNRGSECSIIVTQPRRVAAISIAERVAWERSEQLGDSVGYSVRFDQKMPRSSGSILYMTVGILLRKLESGLHGVSHIFIDEVHERDLNTDFLLVVVKRLAQQHADIRVILMSATISLQKFILYFPGSKVVEIAGRNFPVETFFLEDAVELLSFDTHSTNFRSQPDSLMVCDNRYSEATRRTLRSMSEQEVNYTLVEKIIDWVMNQAENPEMHGSVLIFLPGWEVISHMMKHLRRVFNEKCLFLPLHSQVPKEEQRRVFDNAPPGKIKVILSTNIAETSVTIRDVVYVIDSCRCKIRWFQASHTSGVMTPAMLSRLDVHWAAKHNLTQREGRAGRLRPGFCFRLCTRARYDSLPETLPPEMVRAPLHDVALIVKWLQLGDIKGFLLQCPDPPKMDAIDRAIVTLQDLSALDSYQRLTPVGVQLARLPMEPRMGYALLMAAVFGMAEPMSVIFSTLCYKDPFGSDYVKLGPDWSDAFKTLASVYDAVTKGFYHNHYSNDRQCNTNTLRQILDAAQQLQAILRDMGFPQQARTPLDPRTRQWHVAQYLLALGLDHWSVHKDARRVWVGINESGNIAQNSACAIDTQPPEHFYAYFEQARNHSKVQCRMVSNMSIMPILFGSIVSMPYKNGRVMLDHWLPIACRFDTGALIGAMRAGIEAMMLRVSHTPSLCSSGDQPLHQFISLMYDLLDPRTAKYAEHAGLHQW
eukprot:GEMP01005577.1.p1 GENE.GEMP01005577.1~~GEMP01005577.1.p1  ORF type:complete len:1137 (+),score=248.43 GEMP01005577.1:74-3484(+)